MSLNSAYWVMLTLASVICASTITLAQRTASVTVEAETDLSNSNNNRIMTRQHASNLKTVLLKRRQTLRIYFCLASPRLVSVNQVRYSNDGASDTITVDLNQKRLGDFNTVAENGGGGSWDVFRASQALGTNMALTEGKHELLIAVRNSKDKYGVELDSVTFEVSFTPMEKVNSITFKCDPRASIKQGKIVTADSKVSVPGQLPGETNTNHSTSSSTTRQDHGIHDGGLLRRNQQRWMFGTVGQQVDINANGDTRVPIHPGNLGHRRSRGKNVIF